MDRRFFLALLLSMGVLLLTPRLFPGKPRALPVPAAVDSGLAPDTNVARTNGATGSTTLAAQPRIGAPTGSSAAAPTLAPERTIVLRNELASYDLSSRGALLRRAELARYSRLSGDSGAVQLSDGAMPLLSYRLIAGGDTIAFASLDFAVSDEAATGGSRVTFTAPVGAGTARVRYVLDDSNYVANVEVLVEGVPAPAFLLTDLPRGFDSQERDSVDDQRHLAYAMRSPASGAERIDFRKPDPGERLLRTGPFTWVVAKSKYFLVGILAVDSTASPFAEVQVTGGVRTGKIPTRAQASVVSPIGAQPVRFEIYAGPQQWQRLVALGREFEHANPYGGWISGVVQPFATIAMRILLWMKSGLGLGYGWVLVIFGVAIRVLMWPLNSRMMRSQKVMAKIQPEIQAAQAKHKSDPQAAQQAIFKVYADHGVSPFSPLLGCLPMFLTMPVFLALFFVFGNTIEFRGVPFLWFPDISVKDPLYIAPFLSGGSMFITTWLASRNLPPNPQTKMMGTLMPIMMTVFGFNFASGLNLYWFVQNVASIPQQWLISNERGKQPAAEPVVAGEGARKRR